MKKESLPEEVLLLPFSGRLGMAVRGKGTGRLGYSR